ncbi:hypothetical protein H0E87_003068 [Populus deltoides]|uniref:Uncharacterized protein n=1 Tax=Populus deltoides TaxID=3696 RepID=A0A8T2ZXJ8_POPDE|nr:hypothetical protein H0E87_003068 [Populus deltoides]
MGSIGEIGGETQHKSYWRFSKQDFFPEESPSKAGATTIQHFHRPVSGSRTVSSAVQMMPMKLRSFRNRRPAYMLELPLSCPILLLKSQQCSVFCYTEFAVEIKVAGGSFAYLRIELGDFVAFITAGNILLESILGSAAVARAWTSYFTSLLDSPSNSLRIHSNLAEGFNLLDPISVHVLVIAATIAMTSTRKTSVFNWIATAFKTAVILFVKIAGMNWAKYLVALGALKGMTTILLVGALGQAVYYSYCTSPHDPSMVCSCPTKDKNTNQCNTSYHHFKCSHCFFSSLDVLVIFLSLSTLFIFMMMAVALLARRYYVREITPQINLLKLAFFLLIIIASSMGISAYRGLNPYG